MLIAGGSSVLAFLLLAAVVSQANGPLQVDLMLSALASEMRNPTLDQLMIDASYLCVWQVLVAGGVAASLWLLAWRRWFAAVVIWVSLAGNSLILWAIKSVVARPRPDQVQALLPASGYSFPSGHTFSSLAFYGLLGLMLLLLSFRSGLLRSAAALGIAAISSLVGLSRVYVGAHWPTDVLGGWLLGIAWLSLLGLLIVRGGRTQPKGETSHRTAMLGSRLLVFCVWCLAIIALPVFDPGVRLSGSVGETPIPIGSR